MSNANFNTYEEIFPSGFSTTFDVLLAQHLAERRHQRLRLPAHSSCAAEPFRALTSQVNDHGVISITCFQEVESSFLSRRYASLSAY